MGADHMTRIVTRHDGITNTWKIRTQRSLTWPVRKTEKMTENMWFLLKNIYFDFTKIRIQYKGKGEIKG